MRRLQVALHRQQDGIDGYALRQLADGVVEHSRAGLGVDVLAQTGGLSLGRQTVGDQDDLVWLRRECLCRCKGVVQAGSLGRDYRVEVGQFSRQSGRIAGTQPFACLIRQQCLGVCIECVDLVLTVGRDLSCQPGDGFDCPAPLRRLSLVLIVRVAQAQDTDQILVEHTGRDVQEYQDPLAAHPNACDVAAVATHVAKARDLLSRRCFVQAAGLQALLSLLQGADIGLELFDLLLAGHAGLIVGGKLLALRLQGRGHRLELRLLAGGLACGFLELVVEYDQIAAAGLYLLLELVDLGLQGIGAVHRLHTGLGADDGVEKNDGAKAAADAVQEGERENLDVPSAGYHGGRSAVLILNVGCVADRDQRQLYPWLTDSDFVADMDARTFQDSLTVYERAKTAVVQDE